MGPGRAGQLGNDFCEIRSDPGGTLDVRPGGANLIVMRGPDGN